MGKPVKMQSGVSPTRFIRISQDVWDRIDALKDKERKRGFDASISSLIRQFCVEGLERREGGQ